MTTHGSAFTVSSTNVNPQGYQAAGTPMTVTAVIDFPSKGAESFPSDNELKMSTDLVNSYWVPVLVLDGVKTGLPEKTGELLTLPGWYLSYPSGQKVQVRVILTGNIPSNPSQGQNFLKIQETDSNYNIISTARLEMPPFPVTTMSTPTRIPATPVKKPTTRKIFTPYPVDSPTQESPATVGSGIIALLGALLVMRRK